MSGERWDTAQEYERSYWARVAEGAARRATDTLDFYEWRSEQLADRLESVGMGHLTGGSARTLEIGSGPLGVSAYFPGQLQVALDPLEEFYSREPSLTALRDSDVTYVAGVGEDLPYEDDHFDLVMIENCIDHVRDPGAVLKEILRVLRATGVLYLTVNCRSRWGFWMHRALSRLRIDAGHPHTFTPERVESDLMLPHGFRILDAERGSFYEAWIDDLKGPGSRKRLKGMLGVSEFLVSVLGTPDDPDGHEVRVRDPDARPGSGE